MRFRKDVYRLLFQLPERLSQVPDDLIYAYEVALAERLLKIIIVMGGDYRMFLTQKGRAALARKGLTREGLTRVESEP